MSDQTVHILVEIPQGSSIKYEQDEKSGRIYVDRFIPTATAYPVNYGSIEGAQGKDGDLLDALVLTSQPIAPGMWIKARVIGMLEMEDEEGIDHKLICVPEKPKQDIQCGAWQELSDVPEWWQNKIKQFFEHYKDLEPEKWVKVNKFVGKTEALKELTEAQQKVA
jgi:inorganic pyrophosphatase